MRVPFRAAEAGPKRQARRESDSVPASDRATDPGLAVRVVQGAKAGFMATVAMTAYRAPLARSLPPTARFWTKFVSGGDPGDHPVAALALHLLYGTLGGVGFGLLAPMATDQSATQVDQRGPDDHRETARREAVGLVAGALYGLALSVFGERVMLERVLDMDPEADERLVFHAGHLVYGLSLGTWFGSRTSDGERKDRSRR
jgi:hypothetical protein